MLSTILCTSALVLGVVAVGFALYARAYAHDCYLYVQESNKRSATLKRMTELEVEMTEISDSVVALQDSMKKLRGRIHARTVNAAKSNGTTDPEEWKRETNKRLLGGK